MKVSAHAPGGASSVIWTTAWACVRKLAMSEPCPPMAIGPADVRRPAMFAPHSSLAYTDRISSGWMHR